MCRLVKNC